MNVLGHRSYYRRYGGSGVIIQLAFSILVANLVLVFGSALLFAVGITFGPVWWVLYSLGAILGATVPADRFAPQVRRSNLTFPILPALLLHAILLLAACGIASRFIDVGWDSLEAHQRAVHLIQEGWNIVHPQEGWLSSQPEEGLLRREPSLYTAHLDFNAMYVVSALMGDLPFGFEGGKGYRILLLLMVGVLVSNLLQRAGLGRWCAWLVGLFVAANPVCLYQMWVLFMDFDVAVYSSLAIMALYAMSWKRDGRAIWVAVAAIMMLLVSKRSGLALSLPLAGLFAFWFLGSALGWWGRIRTKNALGVGRFCHQHKIAVSFGCVGLLAVLFLFLVLAARVHDGQTREGAYYSLGFLQRAVFEPDRFDKNLDLVVPRSHEGLSRPEQFVRSLFEKTDVYRGDSIKLPLTWTPDEWKTFRNIRWPGHGSGGFGPLFSGVLIISMVAGALVLRPLPMARSPGWAFRWLMLITLVAICFVLPSWWARWVPFVWLFPLFFLLPSFFLRPKENPQSLLLYSDRNHLVPTVLAVIALMLALVNSAFLFGISTSETRSVSSRIDRELRQLAEQPVVLEPGRNLLTKRWLIERGIDYRLSEDRGPLILNLEPSTSRIYQTDISP